MRGPAIVLAATLAASASSAAPTPGQAQADSFARLYVDAVNSDAGFERFMLHDAEPYPARRSRASSTTSAGSAAAGSI